MSCGGTWGKAHLPLLTAAHPQVPPPAAHTWLTTSPPQIDHPESIGSLRTPKFFFLGPVWPWWHHGTAAVSHPPPVAIPEVPWVAQAWRMGFHACPTSSNFDHSKIPPFGEIVPKTKVGRRHGRGGWGVARNKGCAIKGARVRRGWGLAPPPIRPFPIDWHCVWPLVLPGWGCSAMVQWGGAGIAGAREGVGLGWR